MQSTITHKLTAQGHPLDMAPEAFGTLKPSLDIAHDGEALRARMDEDGYLFLPGYLKREEILAARRHALERVREEGVLDPAFDLMQGVVKDGCKLAFRADLAVGNAALLKALYSGSMLEFYGRFLGGKIRHFDFTWFRAITPGPGTPPHLDVVYMGRGTKQLYTSWVPVGDVDLELGGLMLLENSHKNQRIQGTYGQKDVDTYCSNFPNADKNSKAGLNWDGALSKNPVSLRQNLGGRWLTCPEYRAGDLLVFGMGTIHTSLDNHSRRLRLSSDSRYQLASEPVDERWVGPDPQGHGSASKRGKIC